MSEVISLSGWECWIFWNRYQFKGLGEEVGAGTLDVLI